VPLDHANACARHDAARFRASAVEHRASDAKMRIRMTTLKHRIKAQRARLAQGEWQGRCPPEFS
jgi:hypothetical protein